MFSSAELAGAVFNLALAVLAAGAIVDVLRNGSLFAGLRAWAEMLGALNESEGDDNWRWYRWFVSELMGCAYCLTFHAAFWCALCLWLEWSVLHLLVTWLAVARLVWLIDSFLPEPMRFDGPRR